MFKHVLRVFVLLLTNCIANGQDHIPKIIWSYWHSSDVPALVATCIASWPKSMPGWDIRVLHRNNVLDYLIEDVDIPKEIWNEKYVQTQADMIRFALIRKYGGLWLDATVVLRDNIIKKYMREHDEWFGYYREIFAFASTPNAYSVTKMHAQMYRIIKLASDTRRKFLKSYYNISNDYYFPQRILYLDKRLCKQGICVPRKNTAYSLIKEIRNTKMIRYKHELYEEIFTRTSDVPKHIQSQPLLKLNYEHVDITKALPNSWWCQLIHCTKRIPKKIRIDESGIPHNVSLYVFKNKDGVMNRLDRPLNGQYTWPCYVFNERDNVKQWHHMKRKIPEARRIVMHSQHEWTKYHVMAWKKALENGASQGAIFMKDNLVFVKHWRGWLARILTELKPQAIRFDGLPYHIYNDTDGIQVHNASIAIFPNLGGYYLSKSMLIRAIDVYTRFKNSKDNIILDHIIRPERFALNVHVFTTTPKLAIQKWYLGNFLSKQNNGMSTFDFKAREMSDMQKFMYLPKYSQRYNFTDEVNWQDTLCTSALLGRPYHLKFDTFKIPWNIMQYRKFEFPKPIRYIETPSDAGKWKSYVINLKKDVEKWNRMQRVLPNAIRVPAIVNKTTISKNVLTQSHQNWHSHVDAWRVALQDGCPEGATFFEDDIIMMKGWRGWLASILTQSDVHVLRFDALPFHKSMVRDGLILHHSTFAGSGGYYMSEFAIRKALEYVDNNIHSITDAEKYFTAEHILTKRRIGVDIFTTTPRLAIQDWFIPSQFCKINNNTIKFSFRKRDLGEYLQMVYLPEHSHLYDFV